MSTRSWRRRAITMRDRQGHYSTVRQGGALALALLAPALVAAGPELRLTGRAEQGGLMFGTLPPGASQLTLDGVPVRTTGDGRFIIGFSRDAPAAARLAWRNDQGRARHQPVTVAARQWLTQSLPTLPPRPVPDAEFAARRPGELARLAAARLGTSDLTGWTQAFIRPAAGPVTGVFGSLRILSGEPQAPHSGLDIGAVEGAPVVAPAAGAVRLAEGPFTLEGNVVLLDHGFGLVSAFLHLSEIKVAAGQRLAKGDLIGLVGATGRATAAHLHWGLTWMKTRVDPAQLVPDQ